MTPEGEAPGPGGASRLATTFLLVLMGFTVILIVLSFPAGVYAVFHGGLSTTLAYGSLVTTYLWIGPIPAISPFTVPLGGLFLALTAIYAGLFIFGFRQSPGPEKAAREALRSGVGSLMTSPFFVILVSIGFLSFTAIIATWLSELGAGSVGNPFSNVDPLLEFGSLTFAPLREEVGFRLVLIGLVAFVLSMGKPAREAVKSLWRPSAAYEGVAVGGTASLIIWLATGASAVTFGVCHITCGGGSGWNWAKFPEAAWGGLVLGYLYVRYGLHVATLAHWGVDYLGSAFSFFGQSAYGVSLTSANEFVGQYAVDLDMLWLFGLASFLLVVYLGVKRLAARRPATGVVDKGPPTGGVLEL